MTVEELGAILNDMYSNSLDGEAVAMIHLFGIKHGGEIISEGYTASEIVRAAQINPSYSTEISKGVKLSKYVDVKNTYM